jgi:PIN domain nuclease of toxin-antitoxin system
VAGAVLDTSAIVALLRDEPGAVVVASHLGDALISTVTLQEVIKAMLVRGFLPDAVKGMVDALGLEVRAHEIEDAWAAALLWDATKAKGSGLGDRTCMALAISEAVPAITTDKAWAELAIPGLEVILAR